MALADGTIKPLEGTMTLKIKIPQTDEMIEKEAYVLEGKRPSLIFRYTLFERLKWVIDCFKKEIKDKSEKIIDCYKTNTG